MNPTKNEEILPIKTKIEIERDQTEAALESIFGKVQKGPEATEEVPIEQAVGRLLASEITATMDEPPYSKATASGFVLLPWGTALASPKNPLTFEVIGDMPPASKPTELPTGKALRVKTDDYMSIRRFLEGNYAVIPESDAVREREGKIPITRFIEKHENILVQGSVWKNGNILFEKGHQIRTRDLFLLASQNILKVRVGKPPTVALFSCGEELLSSKEPYRIGCKYDCNAYGLAGMIRDAGGVPLFCGIMRDQLNPFAVKLNQVLEDESVRAVVISGGVSVRKGDFIVDLLKTTAITEQKNSEELIEALKWAVLTGNEIRPHVMGVLKGKPVICLPGEPKAAMRGFRIFAAPVIAHLLGRGKTIETTVEKKEAVES